MRTEGIPILVNLHFYQEFEIGIFECFYEIVWEFDGECGKINKASICDMMHFIEILMGFHADVNGIVLE